MAISLASLFNGSPVWGGNVRTVDTDSSYMAPVNLRMGQSTVLRFPEKPKKVILGNSNYYSIEFIDNDVAIQPLGTIPTNLFVYGPKNVYGFLLRTVVGGAYDDLIQVNLKQNFKLATATVKILSVREVSRPNFTFPVGKNLNVKLSRVQRYKHGDFSILDFTIENSSRGNVSLSNLVLTVESQKKRISPQELVLKDFILGPEGKTTARLMLNLTPRRDFSLNIRWQGKTLRQIVSGRFL
ncbi:MAG: hypothetical protein K2X47_01385 [Bdellovibrionales bacterium]|nr:hypothetical protein [Bdellovibrionales bacterium]